MGVSTTIKQLVVHLQNVSVEVLQLTQVFRVIYTGLVIFELKEEMWKNVLQTNEK